MITEFSFLCKTIPLRLALPNEDAQSVSEKHCTLTSHHTNQNGRKITLQESQHNVEDSQQESQHNMHCDAGKALQREFIHFVFLHLSIYIWFHLSTSPPSMSFSFYLIQSLHTFLSVQQGSFCFSLIIQSSRGVRGKATAASSSSERTIPPAHSSRHRDDHQHTKHVVRILILFLQFAICILCIYVCVCVCIY